MRRLLPLSLALAAVLPAPAIARAAPPEDGLAPLYRRIARDLARGAPIVATVHVALCDNAVIWCGLGPHGNGDAPARNLYWGGAAGLRAYFDHARGWRRVHVDAGDGKVILERVVYRRRVASPSARWRTLGVRGAFDLYLVGIAWKGQLIARANEGFLAQVSGERGEELPLRDGTRLAIGGRGHVVGFAGHNHLLDVEPDYPPLTRKAPLGYFALSCLNARYLGPRFCASSARALLLSRSLMYPGGFTIDGLLQALARAAPQREVFEGGADLYAKFQQRPEKVIRFAFISDGEPRFARAFPVCAAAKQPASAGAGPASRDAAKDAAGKQRAGKQAAGKQAAGKQAAGKQAAGKQAAGKQGAGKQGAGARSGD